MVSLPLVVGGKLLLLMGPSWSVVPVQDSFFRTRLTDFEEAVAVFWLHIVILSISLSILVRFGRGVAAPPTLPLSLHRTSQNPRQRAPKFLLCDISGHLDIFQTDNFLQKKEEENGFTLTCIYARPVFRSKVVHYSSLLEGNLFRGIILSIA